ncbi:BHLH domain-containing protein [Psidium guajava]|nr:BHLH domain-containing protein [Psidium guajava]
MSPAHFNDHHHALFPPPLKTSRDSRSIKKPSPSSSSSSTTAAAAAPFLAAAAAKPSHQQQQQRHPVIIYTHSPKIIHTQPRDFMALVQKLTGLSRSSPDDDPKPTPPRPADAAANSGDGDDAEAKSSKAAAAAAGIGEDNECSSVITEENCSSIGDGQVNSCFGAASGFEAPNGGGNRYLSNPPFLPNDAADFLCSNQPNFYDFNEATVLGFHGNNMRTNFVSYSSFERTNNFREF